NCRQGLEPGRFCSWELGSGPNLVIMTAVLADHGRTHPASPAFRASLGWGRRRLDYRVDFGALFRAEIDTKIRSACAMLPELARIGESLPSRDLGQSQELTAVVRVS